MPHDFAANSLPIEPTRNVCSTNDSHTSAQHGTWEDGNVTKKPAAWRRNRAAVAQLTRLEVEDPNSKDAERTECVGHHDGSVVTEKLQPGTCWTKRQAASALEFPRSLGNTTISGLTTRCSTLARILSMPHLRLTTSNGPAVVVSEGEPLCVCRLCQQPKIHKEHAVPAAFRKIMAGHYPWCERCATCLELLQQLCPEPQPEVAG